MNKDIVYREDVIKATWQEPSYMDAINALTEVRERIKDIPAVEPKQGEWETEYHGNGWNDYWDYTCSNCGKKYERADAILFKSNFCPNCGARMKGENDVNR